MKRDTMKQHDEKDVRPILKMPASVITSIIQTIGLLPAESGGAFGGSEDGDDITHFHFDESSRNSSVTYSPDHKFLNRLFKHKWNPAGIRLRGFVHSHPGRMGRPSYGDEVYAERILRAIPDLEQLWLPIINTVSDTGAFRLTPWVAVLRGSGVEIRRASIQITPVNRSEDSENINADDRRYLHVGTVLDQLVITDAESLRSCCGKASRKDGPVCRRHAGTHVRLDRGQTFARVHDAYDLELMRSTRIIAVGAGGAASWLEEHCRAGGEQFVLIDPDTVSETNLATQQTYRRDIGRPKVDCIAERIRDINPLAKTAAIQKTLDELTDEQIRRLALDPIDGRETTRTIICGLTDAFFAQARVNRLALQLGIPSLCGQVYREGRGLEITFTFPGVTPACHRCVLSSRYRYFLEQGRQNDVTSHGTPIFATTRLNAIKGFVALAIIHYGSDHPRWGNLLSRIGNRNLIQVRTDPDFGETMGLTIFERVFKGADQDRLVFDETVWLPQVQECPETGYQPCPDCGGTGNLRDAKGKFVDTRLTPPPTRDVTVSNEADSDARRQAMTAYKKAKVHS